MNTVVQHFMKQALIAVESSRIINMIFDYVIARLLVRTPTNGGEKGVKADNTVISHPNYPNPMQVKDIIQAIEAYAPPMYQESYDNSGLQVGDTQAEVTGVLLSLDITEAVLAEARQRGCNMVVAHHPLLFSGLKRISGHTYTERVVQQAIKNDLHLYACHTNIDNVHNGVNAKIAGKLGLQDQRILAPMSGTVLYKLYTYAPQEAADKVREALFAAGAGTVGKYTECSFNLSGTGTFRPGPDADPAIGEAGGAREVVAEEKIEVLVPAHLQQPILQALFAAHPYEEVAYELVGLQNANQELGAGMIGQLPETMMQEAFLAYVKERLQTTCIRYTLVEREIHKVAVCGGSGSFLLKNALAAGADAFVTADFKYHQFFDGDGRILIADIGHYESEQFTPQIFEAVLKEKFPNFAILLSEVSTNPVKYFC